MLESRIGPLDINSRIKSYLRSLVKIRKFVFLIPLAAVMLINFYFRLFPVNFPQLKQQARKIIRQQIWESIRYDVARKLPQFYPLAKERIIESNFKAYLVSQRRMIDEQVEQLYRRLKERYQDERGQTYLMELDCWHWARYTENVVKHGFPGDELVGRKQLDRLMLSPVGMVLLWNKFLFYFSGYLYKFVNFFIRGLDLYDFLFYLPIFFIFLLLLALYFFVRRLATDLAAFLACLVAGLSPIFLPRSCAGWFDTDILNLLFPLLVIWTYAISTIKNELRQRILWINLAGFWLGLFCFTWVSWWFVMILVVIYEFIWMSYYLILAAFRKRDHLNSFKEHFYSLLVFLLAGFFWIVVFCGIEPLLELFRMLHDAMILNRPLLPSIWPNVFSTVGELRRSSLNELFNSLGGIFIFVYALLSGVFLFFLLVFKNRVDDYKRNCFLLLLLWFVSMFVASYRGVRFAAFLGLPAGVFIGWFSDEIRSYLVRLHKRWLGWLASAVILILLSAILLPRAYVVSSSIFPLMDRHWYEVLKIIRDKTPADSVINSWWDFGDWFKVVGRRRVIFDGQSQKGQLAYWMARVLLSEREEEAVGILRMLNNGSEQAFEIVNKSLNDPLSSVLLLERVIGLLPQEAEAILKDHLPFAVVQQLMALLYGMDKNAYFVVDPSMIFKISAISYLGNWNFAKVYILHNIKSLEKTKIVENLAKLGKDRWEMERLCQEVSLIKPTDVDNWLSQPWQFYSNVSAGVIKNDLVSFDNGFIYNPANQSIYSNSNYVPQSLFVAEKDKIREFVFTNANVAFSALVYKTEQGEYRLVLLDRKLGRSLFVRLYFLNGLGLDHFKNFISAQKGNEYIRVFRIFW